MSPPIDPAAFIRRFTAVDHPPLLPELALHLATDVTPLWTATQDFLDQHDLEPPFWAFAWPGGQALARLLLDQPLWVRGRRVLSFAAGGGVEAIAAARAGALTVTANDIDPLALTACALNAGLNGVDLALSGLDLLAGDGSGQGGGQGGGQGDGPWDVVLAGDVCYDRAMAARVLPWLRAQAQAGKTVLLADPGRAYLPTDESGLRLVAERVVPTSRAVEEAAECHTRIFQWQALTAGDGHKG